MFKLKRSTLLFLIVLLPFVATAVCLSIFSAPSAQAQIILYVDDDTCPAVGAGTQGSPYCRIQDAVDAANDNYEIRVAAGTYSDVQTINATKMWDVYPFTQVALITKSVTLRGGYSPSDWHNSSPAANLTIIDAEGQGRGVSIVGGNNNYPVVTVDGFTITGGDYTDLGNSSGVSNQECAGTGEDCGGGFYAAHTAFTLRNCLITDNNVSQDIGVGGGVYFMEITGPSRIENTRVISNSAVGSKGNGGGLYAVWLRHPLTISQSVFQDNTALHFGGGARFAYNVEALVTIVDTDFLSNTAVTEAVGGLSLRLVQNGELLHMDRVRFQNNHANQKASAFHLDAAGSFTPRARLSNLLFTGNSLDSANAADAVMNVDGTFTSLEVEMAHVTAVDNSAATFLHAMPGNDPGDTVTVTVKNALLSTFANAYAAGDTMNGAITIEHHNTLTQYVTNLHQDLSGTPTFTAVNPLTGDPKLSPSYHLQSGSAAIDAGVDAGVTTDIDGAARPYGAGFDIGSDEFHVYQVFLPAVVR